MDTTPQVVDMRDNEALPVYVGVIHKQLEFGGSEEGGWWYTSRARVENHLCHTPETLNKVLEHINKRYLNEDIPMSSVLSSGQYQVVLDHEPQPVLDPPYRPHYE